MKRKDLTTSNDAPTSAPSIESDVSAIAVHIFGSDSYQTILGENASVQPLTDKLILENANVWMHKVLNEINPPVEVDNEDRRKGRLGITEVRFDSTAQAGALIMSQDRLHAQAQSNFSSVRANVCVFSGKWQYELQLGSKGVMQLGWTMVDGEFTPESGVGDSVYSFAYDGNRIRKWNLVTLEYGEAWQVGDVIGSTIDLNDGNIHFYRNGKDLGEAFSSIPSGPGCVYFPAISLAYDEKVQVNFGSLPFKYPLAQFAPVQQRPEGQVLRANQLLHWIYRTAGTMKPRSAVKTKKDSVTSVLSEDVIKMIFTKLIMDQLAEYLRLPYVVEACVVPFLHDIVASRNSQNNSRHLSKLNFVLNSFFYSLELEDYKELINTICKCLQQKSNQTSVSLEYVPQKQSLAMLFDICQNTNTRRALLKQPNFVKLSLPELMDLKPIDVLVLKQCIPQAWWQIDDPYKGKQKSEYETKKKNYIASCYAINKKVLDLEDQQENFLKLFFDNTDGNHVEPSSRNHFLAQFRSFVKDNKIDGLVSFFLNDPNVIQTPLPIALNYFHRLVNVLRELWERELPSRPVLVPLSVFLTGDVDYFTIDRAGGVLSYLLTTNQAQLISELGENHRVITHPPPAPAAPSMPTVQLQLRGVDANGAASTVTRWVNLSGIVPQGPRTPPVLNPGPVETAASLYELLDGIILFYSCAAHKQLHKVSILRDDMGKYVKALNEAKARLSSAKESPEAAFEIENSIKALEKKVEEQSRVVMAWVRAAIYTPEKRANLVWLLKVVLLTLEESSKRGDLFSFVPDFYFESLVELCSALRNYFSPTLPLDELTGYKKLFVQVAEFLVNLFGDPRIVNLGCKDTIMEAIAGFVAKKTTLDCLESIPSASQERLVSLLLKPYDNRPWGQSNWILMRMWQGCGFAFRYQRSPHLTHKMGPRTPQSDSALLIHQHFEPCPSPHYQRLVAKTLISDQEMANEFLNSVLKQLNWSFSEFISMMQEIQNLSKRPERVIIDARQLKICATCFDFVIGLLRVLEMVCTVCRTVFTDATRVGTENLLERLCQLLSQILMRVTSGVFSHVVALEVPDLDSIDQFPVLAAVVSVLIALLADDMQKDQSKIMSTATKTLLSEPAFQIDNLKYLIGEDNANKKQETFSLASYPQSVSVDELKMVSRLISYLSRLQARLSEAKEVDDEELCPICCAMPLAVTFMPCHHRSCKSCITHHLMDCKECFFCKTAIQSVMTTEGKLLFDSTTSLHKAAGVSPSV